MTGKPSAWSEQRAKLGRTKCEFTSTIYSPFPQAECWRSSLHADLVDPFYLSFIYGGSDAQWKSAYDDLFILSLPGFVWFRADARSSEPRSNHDCVVIGRRQMLSYGGDAFGQEDYLITKDPFVQGLGIFDMTELAWDTDGRYNADAEDYRTPKVVEDWYRSHNVSDISWSSKEVRDVFLANTINFDKPTSSSTGVSPSATTVTATASRTLTSGSEKPPTNNVGAIAGGIAGGVVILAMIAGLTYYFRFKKSRKSLSPGEETGEPKVPATQDVGKLEARKELPTEPSAAELFVPPGELANSLEAWELDGAGRTGELDASNSTAAYELHTASPVVPRGS